jgi:hypothetical protein
MTYTTEAMLATFLSLDNIDQIHVAIARECQTQRGKWRCTQRYSRERLDEHNEWVKANKELLAKFNLKGGQI